MNAVILIARRELAGYFRTWLGYVIIAAVLVLPFAERWTGRETHLTLLEWGDLNRPLLQRLSLEAPGTYAHTIAIANLAEAACRAIGANAVTLPTGTSGETTARVKVRRGTLRQVGGTLRQVDRAR